MSQISITKPLFGKVVEFILYDVDEISVSTAVEDAYQEGLRLSRIFNFFDSSSELSRLNKKGKLVVSNDLLIVLKKALEYAELTKGAYDISLGKLFMQRKIQLPETKLSCTFKDILIVGHLVTLAHPDVMVDLGSVAKGYIADKMAEVLKDSGILSGMVNARGDITAFGEEKREVSIQHPRDRDKTIGSLYLQNSAVATSGDYNQFFGSFEKSHILNSKDSISVTVVADDLLEADAMATSLFVLDKESRQSLLNRKPLVKSLIVDNKVSLEYYNGFKDLIVPR